MEECEVGEASDQLGGASAPAGKPDVSEESRIDAVPGLTQLEHGGDGTELVVGDCRRERRFRGLLGAAVDIISFILNVVYKKCVHRGSRSPVSFRLFLVTTITNTLFF